MVTKGTKTSWDFVFFVAFASFVRVRIQGSS